MARGPALSEFWLSATGLPALVVSRSPDGFEELSLGCSWRALLAGKKEGRPRCL